MTVDKAIVVGAGPGGLAAAIALRQLGIDVRVFERRADLGAGGSGLTLWPNAMAALSWLGLADAVNAVSAVTSETSVRTANGRLLDATDHGVMQRHFGHSGAALLRADLQSVLADALGRARIRTGAGLERLKIDGDDVHAWFADGTEQRVSLLVGADGMHSRVRGAISSRLPLRYAGYTVWRGVAHFALGDEMGTLSLGRGAQFGLFPMPAGTAYWFASLNRAQSWPDLRASELLEAFAGWHDPVERVISATKPSAILATRIYDAPPSPLRVRGPVALVGDAGHPSTPGLGQGACQAIEDAVTLARCLREYAPVTYALAEYERARAGRTNAMTRQARWMGAVGQWHAPAAVWLRDNLIAHTPHRLRLRQLRWLFSFDPEAAP